MSKARARAQREADEREQREADEFWNAHRLVRSKSGQTIVVPIEQLDWWQPEQVESYFALRSPGVWCRWCDRGYADRLPGWLDSQDAPDAVRAVLLDGWDDHWHDKLIEP